MTTEEDRVHAQALEDEATLVGQKTGLAAREAMMAALAKHSSTTYGQIKFDNIADRDLFLTRMRSALYEELERGPK